jgi:type IV pilus assembly protein PilV
MHVNVSLMLKPSKAASAPFQRGFTLLEVMIALLVLSIGLLGLAALQGVGLRGSQEAYLTSQASLLAYDLADRIRANPAAAVDDYNNFAPTCPEPVPTAPLAAADLGEWFCSVENLLPNGTASIVGTFVDVPDVFGGFTRYTITINWEELRQLQDEDDLREFQLVVEI